MVGQRGKSQAKEEYLKSLRDNLRTKKRNFYWKRNTTDIPRIIK